MPVRFGNTTPKGFRFGSTTVKRLALGAVQIWVNTIYPQTGSWYGVSGGNTGFTDRATHTIAEPGSYTLYIEARTYVNQFNNTQARISGPWGTVTGSSVTKSASGPSPWSTATTTQTLAVGDLIRFQTSTTSATEGSWSIVKN